MDDDSQGAGLAEGGNITQHGNTTISSQDYDRHSSLEFDDNLNHLHGNDQGNDTDLGLRDNCNLLDDNGQGASLPEASDGYLPSLKRSLEQSDPQGFDGLYDAEKFDAFSDTTQPNPPNDGTGDHIEGEDDDVDDEPVFDPDDDGTDNEAEDNGKHSQAKDANGDADNRVKAHYDELEKEREQERLRQQEEKERLQKQLRDRPIMAPGQRQQWRQLERTLYD